MNSLAALLSLAAPALSTEAAQRRIHADALRAARAAGALLISTLPADAQHCLVSGTVECAQEEARVNAVLAAGAAAETEVVVYGAHACDPTPYEKQRQLRSLGFARVSVYAGGLFEYLLLQEVFGEAAFPTRGREPDLLRAGGFVAARP